MMDIGSQCLDVVDKTPPETVKPMRLVGKRAAAEANIVAFFLELVDSGVSKPHGSTQAAYLLFWTRQISPMMGGLCPASVQVLEQQGSEACKESRLNETRPDFLHFFSRLQNPGLVSGGERGCLSIPEPAFRGEGMR